MLKFGNKEFRNLTEQVCKNQKDIESIKQGIIIYKVLNSFEELVPYIAEDYLGKYFLIDHTLQIITKNDDNEVIAYNLGQYPLKGEKGDPGIAGEKGEKGDEGARGPAGERGYPGLPGSSSGGLSTLTDINLNDNIEITAAKEMNGTGNITYNNIDHDIDFKVSLPIDGTGIISVDVAEDQKTLDVKIDETNAAEGKVIGYHNGNVEWVAGSTSENLQQIDENITAEEDLTTVNTDLYAYQDLTVGNNLVIAGEDNIVDENNNPVFQGRLTAGANITISANNVISASGGGGGGAVDSVNGKTGTVVLKASDINANNSTSIQANLDRLDERADILSNTKLTKTRDALEANNILLKPTSTLTNPVLVGLAQNKTQQQISIGDGLDLTNNTLSATGGSYSIKTGTTVPTTSTTADFVGQLYHQYLISGNTITDNWFICSNINESVYTWNPMLVQSKASTLYNYYDYGYDVPLSRRARLTFSNDGISTELTAYGTIKIGSNQATNGGLEPNVDNRRLLGSSTARWKDLYLSGNLSDGTNVVSIEDLTLQNKYLHKVRVVIADSDYNYFFVYIINSDVAPITSVTTIAQQAGKIIGGNITYQDDKSIMATEAKQYTGSGGLPATELHLTDGTFLRTDTLALRQVYDDVVQL